MILDRTDIAVNPARPNSYILSTPFSGPQNLIEVLGEARWNVHLKTTLVIAADNPAELTEWLDAISKVNSSNIAVPPVPPPPSVNPSEGS
jgi:hypothetical protein